MPGAVLVKQELVAGVQDLADLGAPPAKRPRPAVATPRWMPSFAGACAARAKAAAAAAPKALPVGTETPRVGARVRVQYQPPIGLQTGTVIETLYAQPRP